ncbi:UNVERIFIED_CONTAM: Transposon TX1 uncharacterized protein [Sesamum indicum]
MGFRRPGCYHCPCKENGTHGTTVVQQYGVYGRDWIEFLLMTEGLRGFLPHHIIVFYSEHLTTRRLSFMGIHRNIMENIWQHEVIGVPMYAVTRKLKVLKQVFRQQRRNKGDLTRNVQLAKGFLDEAQTLHCCRMVYAKAAKTEQIMLQQRAKMQWMKDGDQCSRVFFRKIAQRRAMRRILQINDEHGTTHTDPGEVVHEFVTDVEHLVDINYLRPWERYILSDEEASHLLSPFSPEEVKLAVFDIAEDKASGPDGYSSGFYKAAWPVVGADVTRAVLDFFSTGRLLKQVNFTLLALIPKAAFIPGRSIGDNIMLAQEVFMGYNQARLPSRCALKVDIRKAYDTVEWDFLVATLQLFGFPPTFTRARGLRQGDPLSPFLFVLVMEVLHIDYMQLIEQDMQFKYHWKCEPARVFQLGFADDLLLFCRADLDSVRVLKVGLDRFAEWSGLRLNIQKSHIIISRSAQERKDQLLPILEFQEGHLPMRYLGLPLISSRLTISDCQPLLSKIDARIVGWEGMSLSYAGRPIYHYRRYKSAASISSRSPCADREIIRWLFCTFSFSPDHSANRSNPVLKLQWNSYQLDRITTNHQQIPTEKSWQYIRALQESIAITIIYGANEVVERRELWGSLETIAMQCIDIPWLVGGDFNAVRDLSEICGASGDIHMAMEEFNICIQNAGLIPLPMQGEWYTWHNCSANPRNLWKRLDRTLINDTWMDRFSTSFYTSLTPRTSNHSPLVLYRDSRQHYGGMFRFDNYLALSPEFIPSVQQVWQHNIIGVPMYAVTRKLKALKPVFREQRRKKGDLSHNVQLAKGFLQTAQLLVTLNRRDELFLQLEHCCRLVLAKAAKLEQIMLQQRAKMQWMKGGDQCSRVFFRKIAQRRSARRILQINDDHGDTHTGPGAVVNEFVTFYHSLLGGERR